MGSNQEQIDFWSGVAGQRWVAAQEEMDRTIRPLGDAAMAALDLAPGLRVLDVGCGCGDTTLAIAERVGPSGRVLGVDISEPMLARARERAATVPTVEFQFADAANTSLGTVDRIYSRFGVMFFDDPVAAFRNLRSPLAPGGRLAFVCWRPLAANPWARLPLEAVNAVLGPPPVPATAYAPGPFAFADASRVRSILGDAGFQDVAIEPFDAETQWTSSTSDEALRETFVRIGPAARRLVDAPEDLRERAIDAILDAVRPLLRPEGLVLPAAVWVVTARP